jgi:hypothetical protein
MLAAVAGFLGFGLVGRRFFQATALAYLIAILAMTDLGWPLWRYVWALRSVQFPWRLLGLTAVCQMIGMAGVVGAARVARSRFHAAFILAAVLLAVAALFQPAMYFPREVDSSAELVVGQAWADRLEGFHTLDQENELLPLSVTNPGGLCPRGDTPVMEFDPPVRFAQRDTSRTWPIAYCVENDTDTTVLLRQFYFPGWRITVDGRALSDAEVTRRGGSDGFMYIELPSGRHQIVARYDGPPGWRLRSVIVLAIVAGTSWLLWRLRKVADQRAEWGHGPPLGLR